MKKLSKFIKKSIITLAITAITLLLSLTAVSAATTKVLGDYTAALDRDRSFQPVSWIVGHFQTGNSSHNGRAGTHYNPGSLRGKAVTKLYYNTRKSRHVKVTYQGENTRKNFWGWIESDWVTAPNNYTSCSKIYFCGYKYNSSGKISLIERIDVNS